MDGGVSGPGSFTDALAERVLLGDGAMGTLAQATGARAEGPGVELAVVAPELVAALHERYLDAGADVIQTHSFGATRPRLERHGLGRRVRELNLAAARIAVAAAAARPRPVFVAGSVSPATALRDPVPDPPAARAAVREQAAALAEGGVDVVLLETFGHLAEIVDAVAAVREATDLPVVAQVTFADDDGEPVTARGETPGEVADRLADLGLAAIGTNCTLGPQGLLAVVRRMQGRGVALTAQPNAGLPHVVSDRSVRFAADTAHFGRYVARYVAAGARLVGGCCGTTPRHVAAAAATLAGTTVPDPPPRAEPAPSPVGLVRGIGARPPAPSPAPAGPARGRGALARWLDAPPARRTPLVAVEVAGPGGDDPDGPLDRARAAADAGAGLLWVGRERSRRPRTTPAGLAVRVHDGLDVDTALTVTSWDASPMALQADLLGLDALGVRTLVCETGNPPVQADRPVGDGRWEVDAVGLVRLAVDLNAGRDVDGLDLAGATSFRLGARATPGAEDLDREIERVAEKVDAGAEFLLTRAVHEAAGLRALLDGLAGRGITVPVLVLITPLLDFGHAEHLRHEVPGVRLPSATLERMRAAGDDPRAAARTGLALARELVEEVAGFVDGVVVRRVGDATDLAAVITALTATLRAGRR